MFSLDTGTTLIDSNLFYLRMLVLGKCFSPPFLIFTPQLSWFSFQFNPKYMMMASACSSMSFWLPSVEDEV